MSLLVLLALFQIRNSGERKMDPSLRWDDGSGAAGLPHIPTAMGKDAFTPDVRTRRNPHIEAEKR
ncbi:hypothetical protein FB548_1397 [Pseudoxanthomonas sp. 3HH-4]|nr:hypothetical protein FB548_1397 [Pseudoxanthomonas sp. 3HH-4]